MAKQSGVSHKRPHRRKQKPAEGGFFWNLLAFLSILAAITMFISAGLTEWRVSDEITYNVMNGRVPTSTRFDPTSYGLYMVKFSGGIVTKNWSRLESQICTGIDAIAPFLEGASIISSVGCSTACIAHFRTRCQVYGKLRFWGMLVLGCLIISGCFGLVAAAWLFVFGVNRLVLETIWLGTGFLTLAVIGYWIMISDQSFSSLGVESQYPYPPIAVACYMGLVASSLYVISGIIALIVSWLSDRQEWQKRQEEIQLRILGAQSDEPFGKTPFPPGMPPGAYPPSVGRPMPYGHQFRPPPPLPQYGYQQPGLAGRMGGRPGPPPPPGMPQFESPQFGGPLGRGYPR